MLCFKWNGNVSVMTMTISMLCLTDSARAGGQAWSLVDPCSVEPELKGALCNERVLAWDHGKILASSVYLKVDMPFPEARAMVAKALAKSGKVEESDGRVEWNALPEDWQNAVFVARPDLRQKWAERKIRPVLEDGVRCGAFPASDTVWRMKNAATFSRLGPEDLDLVLPAKDSLTSGASADQRPVKYEAIRRKSSWFGNDRSELDVLTFDATHLFGRPTTAILLKRTDELPNPQYRSLLRSFLDFWRDLLHGRNPLEEWNLLAGPQSKTFLKTLVPAQEFEALRTAFEAGKHVVEVESWAENWFVTLATPAAPILENVETITAVPSLLKSMGKLSADIDYSAGLIALPGGELVFSGQSRSEPDTSGFGIWMLRPNHESWNAQAIWKGSASGFRLEVAADGTGFWFDGSTGKDDAIQSIYRYDLRSGLLHGWALEKSDELSQWLSSWRLDAGGVPFGFHRNNENEAVLQATRLVPQQGDSTGKRAGWFVSPRAKFVKEAAVGMCRSSSQGAWLVDDAVSKIEPATGHTLLSWPIPFGSRLGNHPTVLEFPSSQSVALGFVTDSDRFGMHLLDLETGSVRSAWNRDGKLVCAARSGGGRWLAMGGRSFFSAVAWAKLFDVRTGTLMATLDVSSVVAREIRALAFSWDGKTLWGIGDDALLRWNLPDAIIDPAKAGEFPDQVRAAD